MTRQTGQTKKTSFGYLYVQPDKLFVSVAI